VPVRAGDARSSTQAQVHANTLMSARTAYIAHILRRVGELKQVANLLGNSISVSLFERTQLQWPGGNDSA
jgi:hypothetical protein